MLLLNDESLSGISCKKNGVEIIALNCDNNLNLENKRRKWYDRIFLYFVVSIAFISNFPCVMIKKIRGGKKKSMIAALREVGMSVNHYSSLFVDRFSAFNHQAKIGAMGWRALKLFYNYESEVLPKLNGNLEDVLTRYWIGGMENRQAVTNRKKIVVKMLVDFFRKFSNEPMIHLISIASGSAQAVLDAIVESGQRNIRTVLIDLDITALEESKREIEKLGYKAVLIPSLREKGAMDRIRNELCDPDNTTIKFVLILGSTDLLEKISSFFRPHGVEMVGFTDYRQDHKAMKLFARIRENIVDGGQFFTCNIIPNWESPFLSWVLLWRMIYRSVDQFSALVVGGKFEPQKIKIFVEPLSIHAVAVATK